VGLFRAMLQEAIEPFGRILSAAAEVADGAPSADLAALIGGHVRTAAANSWIATLIVNEVLPEGGQFRATFVRDIAARLLPMLVEVLEHGRKNGTLRSDIDPKLTALSILSLNIFPLLARPITAPVLSFKLEGEEVERFIAHTTGLLLRGIGAARSGA
jgi:TetR/AcrR family transcriptional regulator